MKNPFAPNGIRSIKIIFKLAKLEFGEAIKESNNYISIKRDIVREVKRMKPDELEENRLNTLVNIEHIKQNDFSNFISIRFAYWGMTIAIAVFLIGDIPIYSFLNMSRRCFGNMIIILLSLLLITMARTINMQHDQLEYLNFKLICFEEIKEKQQKRK